MLSGVHARLLLSGKPFCTKLVSIKIWLIVARDVVVADDEVLGCVVARADGWWTAWLTAAARLGFTSSRGSGRWGHSWVSTARPARPMATSLSSAPYTTSIEPPVFLLINLMVSAAPRLF
ncbi:hypothetical protein [Pyrobaculum ferrireducens]|uniref:hypothetical protein n=1 Tax=Pyrobaculum ferrireducens TaxID=1104324 RepID=UPI0011E52B7C|nr:hypothetical protein [Pyrobaculum ferrireducens]